MEELHVHITGEAIPARVIQRIDLLLGGVVTEFSEYHLNLEWDPQPDTVKLLHDPRGFIRQDFTELGAYLGYDKNIPTRTWTALSRTPSLWIASKDKTLQDLRRQIQEVNPDRKRLTFMPRSVVEVVVRNFVPKRVDRLPTIGLGQKGADFLGELLKNSQPEPTGPPAGLHDSSLR